MRSTPVKAGTGIGFVATISIHSAIAGPGYAEDEKKRVSEESTFYYPNQSLGIGFV